MKRKKFFKLAFLRQIRRSRPTPRALLAFKMLKRVKVKGGRADRLCVAPSYGRQLERFLSA